MKFPWRGDGRPKSGKVKLTLRLKLKAADALSQPISTFSEPEVGEERYQGMSTMAKTARYTYNDLGDLLNHPKQRVEDISLLHPADMIAFPRELLADTYWMGYWHLAIVESVDITNKIINLIHYQPIFDDTYHAEKRNRPSKFEKGSIVRTALPFADDHVWIVELNPLECLPAAVVLQRAISRIGESKYDILFNNCESFAFWCKTGDSSSSQSNTACKVAVQQGTRAVTKVAVKKVAEKAISKGILRTVLRRGPTIGARAVQQMGKLFAAVDVAIGTGFVIRDILKAKKKLKEGKIDKKEYKNAVGTRVVVATGDMSCAVLGTMAGTTFGGPVGAIIGGTIGSGVGMVLGSAAANAVVNNQR